jgi:hypothetical protein
MLKIKEKKKMARFNLFSKELLSLLIALLMQKTSSQST